MLLLHSSRGLSVVLCPCGVLPPYSYIVVLLAFPVPGFWWLAALVANVCKVERGHGFPVHVQSLFQLGLLPVFMCNTFITYT